MITSPEFPAFKDTFESGRPQVVWTKLVADLDTPVSAMLKLGAGRTNSFLLESVESGAVRGRYSFIGLEPDLVWRCRGDAAEVNRGDHTDDGAFVPCDGGAIDSLRAIADESRIDLPTGLPPMAAGLVGYMGYDMVRLVERLPDDNPDLLDLPDGIFIRPTIMAVFDNIEDSLTIITPVRPGPPGPSGPPGSTGQNKDAQSAYDAALARLADVVSSFEKPLPHGGGGNGSAEALNPTSNMTYEAYGKMVERAKEYILAGDIFQVVLSQRFQVPFPRSAFSLYRALRRLNPSPFLFILDFGGFSVVGSSPEILVRVRDGTVTIRPIAGTRPRGATPEEDKALAQELLADPKELAEHLMLLDLGRNDVGRVARVNTVQVTQQMTIENYSHVMHIVSNVEGQLDPRYDSMDALLAGFPAGTVSGAPKVRAMEIIDELEPVRRGVYAGCIGYFGADGEMDTCIALRTAVVKDGVMYVQAGGGIVADSDPEAEFQESCNKARALLRAAEEAHRYSGG